MNLKLKLELIVHLKPSEVTKCHKQNETAIEPENGNRQKKCGKENDKLPPLVRTFTISRWPSSLRSRARSRAVLPSSSFSVWSAPYCSSTYKNRNGKIIFFIKKTFSWSVFTSAKTFKLRKREKKLMGYFVRCIRALAMPSLPKQAE